MADMQEHMDDQIEAGPSSPSTRSSLQPGGPPSDTILPSEPSAHRTLRSATPTSHPSSSPTQSRNASRSPSTSRRGVKRSTFSPVPEETAHASSSTTTASTESSQIKRSRSAASRPDADAKRRGQRLFGVLTSTLSQFKRESESDRAATAAQRRAQIEARLATKLKHSEKAIEATERKRALLWEARSLAEQIASGDAQRKTLRAMKRRMASFLYTPHQQRSIKSANEEQRLAAEIPTSMASPSKADDRDGEFALYFLPGKTLPEQEDKLNDQEDSVDEKIDQFDDRWEEARARLVEQLEGVKRRLRDK